MLLVAVKGVVLYPPGGWVVAGQPELAGSRHRSVTPDRDITPRTLADPQPPNHPVGIKPLPILLLVHVLMACRQIG